MRQPTVLISSAMQWCVIGLLLVTGSMPLSAAARRPNVILLLADDLGYADVGFQGCRDIPTPNIDALAQGGVRCTQGYVSGPYCSPTRAGLMTGRYQNRFGHEFNGGMSPSGEHSGLPLSEMTIAQRFQTGGYRTGLLGKWHLGSGGPFHPLDRGFDEFFGFLDGAHSYFPGDRLPILRGRVPVVEPTYLTDAIAREAGEFIDRHREHPFFLYVAFNAVHTPMQATDARLKRFESIQDRTRRTYAAMLSAMDEAIGTIQTRIKDRGLESQTLFVFLSDNGGPTMKGTTVNGSRNTPLRGSKRTTLEGGIRVPFVVCWPGQIQANSQFSSPVIQLDLLPTLLAAAGIPVPAEPKLDGVNLLPYFSGAIQEPPHPTLFWRFGTQRAIRHGDWKLVEYDPQVESAAALPGRKLRKDPIGPPRLYHLGEDLGETKDRAKDHPEIVSQLDQLWKAWNANMVPPLSSDGSY